MPTIKYSDNPNEETAFVTQDGGQRNRAVLTAAVSGTIKYPDNPNSTKVTVTVDGVEHKAVAVADISGGGGDQHNLGYYATQAALEEAHPTAEAGDWAIIGATDTVWIWDTDNSTWVDSDTKGQVTSVNNQTGEVTIGANDILPSQTGNSGKFLTTDGTDASWSDKPVVNQGLGILGALAICGTSNASTASANGASAIAIGRGATAGMNYGIAIGAGATASALRSIQFGNGTNSDAETFKIANVNGNYEIMSADGTVPTARLTKVNTTATLAVADWSLNTQTVSVTGITATGVVFVSPDPSDQADYTSAGILCTTQAAGTLTFTCDTTPSNDIDVVVVMM